MTTRIDRVPIVVAALVTGHSEQQAAELAGCSVRTVRRIKADNRTEIDGARRDVAERIADALAGRVAATIDRLAAVAALGNDRDAVAAARVVLTEGRAWRDTGYIEDRLAAVEQELAEQRRQDQQSDGWGA